MDRIGMSTVNFRNRFGSTKSEDAPPAEQFEITDIPEYFADRFSLHNVELWSKHFESLEPAYLKKVKKALKKSKSRLINIQCDEDYQLGDPDEAKRTKSLELALDWLEVAKKLGAGAIRFNPGNGEPDLAIKSLKALNSVAKNWGLILMTENHFGMEMDTDVHLKIVKGVGDNMYTLPDFGNYAAEKRYDSLAKIMPLAYQVSAKTIEFSATGEHLSFDFDKCMKMAVDAGFKGIYSVEQWSPQLPLISDEAMADWMIKKVIPFCS